MTPLSVGSPQEVIDKTLTFREHFGDYQRQLFLIDHAGLPLATVLHQLDLLGEEVVPTLRREMAARRDPEVPDAPTHASLVKARYGDQPPRQPRPNANRGDHVTGAPRTRTPTRPAGQLPGLYGQPDATRQRAGRALLSAPAGLMKQFAAEDVLADCPCGSTTCCTPVQCAIRYASASCTGTSWLSQPACRAWWTGCRTRTHRAMPDPPIGRRPPFTHDAGRTPAPIGRRHARSVARAGPPS